MNWESLTIKAYDLSRIDCLLVDDHREMRTLLQALLRGLGVNRIRAAVDGTAALRKLREQPADLVITDWKMAPMDGLDLVRELRDEFRSPCPTVPIIMITAHTERERVAEARDVGVTEFLAKPVTIDALYKRLVSVIEDPRDFVRTKHYFGPDRRRKQREFEGEDRRRNEPQLADLADRASGGPDGPEAA